MTDMKSRYKQVVRIALHIMFPKKFLLKEIFLQSCSDLLFSFQGRKDRDLKKSAETHLSVVKKNENIDQEGKKKDSPRLLFSASICFYLSYPIHHRDVT